MPSSNGILLSDVPYMVIDIDDGHKGSPGSLEASTKAS